MIADETADSEIVEAGPRERIYPVDRIAQIVRALKKEGAAPGQVLKSLKLTEADLSSPATRVSQDDVLVCWRNALRLSADPYFAFHTGLSSHVSDYGMFGFAILSSTNFREAVRFAVRHQSLIMALAKLAFTEVGERAKWTIAPISHPDMDSKLYRGLVEFHLGSTLALHREVIGPTFWATELHVRYGPIDQGAASTQIFGCPILFRSDENSVVFEREWLDKTPDLGNELAHQSVVRLCDQMLDQLKLYAGVAGQVREILLRNMARSMRFEAVAQRLNTTPRTLRRRLRDESTSFRHLMDEVRMHVAIKYLQETDLKVEEIASALNFSDAANFRHAFHRWTGTAPTEFRPKVGLARGKIYF